MVAEQVTETKLDEITAGEDLAWPIPEEQNRDGIANDVLSANDAASQSRFEGLIHLGQNVFLSDGQFIGRITNLLPGISGQVSYLVVRTPHLWGQSKILAIALVSDVNPKVVRLSIDQSKFEVLPKYKTDAVLKEEVESALWNDEVLRVTDYHEVDVQVKNGIVSLTGHITGVMNQDRIEIALGNVKSILGARIQLIADDKLLLKVAEALVQIGRVEGNSVFAQVQNGVVALSGDVISPDVRDSAEQCAANVPWVRGVINNIAAPGVDPKAEDQLFLQPTIGEKIYFRDSLIGNVRQVVISRHNRRVVDMIIQGRFPDGGPTPESMSSPETQAPERLVVVPVKVIRYLTSESGFLLIDSTDTTQYQDFDPARFVAPGVDWTPPYPYSSDDVLFVVE